MHPTSLCGEWGEEESSVGLERPVMGEEMKVMEFPEPPVPSPATGFSYKCLCFETRK